MIKYWCEKTRFTEDIGYIINLFRYGVPESMVPKYQNDLRVLLMTEILMYTTESPSIPEMDLKAANYILFTSMNFTPHLTSEYAKIFEIKYKFGDALLLTEKEIFHNGFALGTYLHEEGIRNNRKGRFQRD